MQVHPYLTFNGDCEQAFNFYAEVLGGQINAMMPHEGTPMAEHVPASWRQKILHAQMQIGDSVLMGSDAPPDRYTTPQGFSVSLMLTDDAQAEHVFATLAQGGQIQLPLQPTFWASRFGMTVDRFGTPWMINCGDGA